RATDRWWGGILASTGRSAQCGAECGPQDTRLQVNCCRNVTHALPMRSACSGAVADLHHGPLIRPARGPDDGDRVGADLLAERIAVQSQEFGGTNLVAATGIERHSDERRLDLVEDPLVQPAGWQFGRVL